MVNSSKKSLLYCIRLLISFKILLYNYLGGGGSCFAHPLEMGEHVKEHEKKNKHCCHGHSLGAGGQGETLRVRFARGRSPSSLRARTSSKPADDDMIYSGGDLLAVQL